MAYEPLAGLVPQYQKSNGDLASGFYLKFHIAGTPTALSMSIDNTGNTLIAKCQINSSGYPITDASAVFIPHLDQNYKISLYPTSADADADTNAEWSVDNLKILPGDVLLDSVAEMKTVGGAEGSTLETTSYFAGWEVAGRNPEGGAVYNVVSLTLYTTITGRGSADDLIDHLLDNGNVAMLTRKEKISVLECGAKGDGVSDDSPSIENAIAIFSPDSITVFFPARTYLITPALTSVWEGAGNMTYAFLMRDNMSVEGEPGSIIKVADNVSTDPAPLLMCMFFNTLEISDITIKNLILDMNGANNPISPSRPASYNRFNQAQIHVTGTPGGVAARVDNALIQDCSFINTPGVSCILMAQSNTAAVTIGKRWRVLNCVFDNNGLDTDDHSSIFGWADNVLIDGCIFSSDTMHGTVGSTGGLVAYEVHGANTTFVNNTIRNYYQGMWVAANLTSDTDNVIIANNTMSPVKDYGVGFFRESAPEAIIKKVIINGNTIGMTDDTSGVSLKAAVLITSAYSVSDVSITNNIVSKIGTDRSSVLVNLGPQSVASNTHTNIKIDGNYTQGTTFGVYMFTNATNGLGDITVSNNDFVNLDDTAAFAVIAGVVANISGSNTIDSLSISGNNFTDANGNCDRGIFLEMGTITDLHVNGNHYKGMILEDYTEGSGLTVTSRSGCYPSRSFTPTWSAGGAITLGDGTVQGNYTMQNGLVFYTAKLIVGSTTTFPGGTLSVDIPQTAATSGVNYQGHSRTIDSGTNTRFLGICAIDGTGNTATLEIEGGTFATNGAPLALATSDELHITIQYAM